MNLAITKLLLLINLFLPGAIPQGFIFSGTTATALVTLCAPGTIATCTVAANAPINTGIIVAFGSESIVTSCGSSIYTLSDDKSNIYGCDQIYGSASNLSAQISHATASTALASGTDTITISPSSNLNWTIVDVAPFVGVDSSAGAAASNGSSTSVSLSLGTTTGTSDLCIAQISASKTSALTITAGSGWTAIGTTYNNGDIRYFLTEYEIVPNGTAVTVTGTISIVPSDSGVAGQCYKL